MPTAKSQAFSIGLHALIALLLLAASQTIRAPLQQAAPIHATPLTFSRPRNGPEARGGGSNQTTLPARHGTPPPAARRTFIPPVSSDHPQLAMPITIAFDMPTDNNIRADIGDPFSRLTQGGLGIRGANGIGEGCCQGIGDSTSGRLGIAVVRGRGVTPPQLVYKVEPEFSEEARKAKHQGVVVLTIEVDAGGNVRNVRVQRSLGLGLDEKAVDAVLHWRFRPAILDGKAVTTEATVQVNFQLL